MTLAFATLLLEIVIIVVLGAAAIAYAFIGTRKTLPEILEICRPRRPE